MPGFAVNAVVLHQSGQELYCFVMNSARLRRICYVTPRSKDAPEEIQRLVDVARAKRIGEYIKQANALLPNALVVSLIDEVTITATQDPAIKTLHFPDDQGKFAYILDGQHRLRGFEFSDGKEFDLPVVGLHGADEALRGKVFADINSKQVPVSDVHLLSLYYQIGDAAAEDRIAMDVMTKLNEDPNSPLRDRIRMVDGQKGTWIKNSALRRLLRPHLSGAGGVLSNKSPAEQAAIMKAYFSAVSQLWPDAWGNTKDFNLCTTLGFELMLGIFRQVKVRCDLNRGKQYTPENFLAMLEPLRDASVEVPGGGEVTLDWQRGGSMAVVGNAAMKRIVIGELAKILMNADEAVAV